MTDAPEPFGIPQLTNQDRLILHQLFHEVFNYKTIPKTCRLFELEEMAMRISAALVEPPDEPPF